ncbi:hypothetical protein SESBI_25603 [Sesbania bispinosa]|nr:hypothetical protein SESBI_25603 [Sesbania bispinosa]
MEFATVRDMVSADGEWDTSKFRDFIPDEILGEIMGNVPHRQDSGEDKLVWGLSDNGEFSTKSAYHFVAHSNLGPMHRVWRVLWNCQVPHRNQKVFMGKDPNINECARHILVKASEFQHCFARGSVVSANNQSQTSPLIRWEFPKLPFVKCNVDASLRDGGQKSACGGLFRNSAGIWIDGFVRNIGQATITMSEL